MTSSRQAADVRATARDPGSPTSRAAVSGALRVRRTTARSHAAAFRSRRSSRTCAPARRRRRGSPPRPNHQSYVLGLYALLVVIVRGASSGRSRPRSNSPEPKRHGPSSARAAAYRRRSPPRSCSLACSWSGSAPETMLVDEARSTGSSSSSSGRSGRHQRGGSDLHPATAALRGRALRGRADAASSRHANA
jgi:hypothetical protein